MQAGEEVATFDLDVVRRFADLAVEGLAAAREEIDALNVYPVPDGDTGTNMFLTVESARDALVAALEEHPGDLRAGMQAYSRGALLGARGNSGVILSQLVGALLRRIGQAGPEDRSASVFAEGMALATEAAYSAVGRAGRGHDPLRGEGGVARPPPRPPRRRRAGSVQWCTRPPTPPARRWPSRRNSCPCSRRPVSSTRVDGGCAWCSTRPSRRSPASTPTTTTPQVGTSAIPMAKLPTGDLTEDGPAYEVMYLLEADDDVDPARCARRWHRSATPSSWSAVRACGTCTSTSTTWVPRSRPASGPAPRAGSRSPTSPSRWRGPGRSAPSGADASWWSSRPARGWWSCSPRPGAEVIEGGPGRRPSTGQILAAIEATGAQEVIVLPNDPDSIGVAEAAAHEAEQTRRARRGDPDARPGAGHRRARRARARPPAGQRRGADGRRGARCPARRGDGRGQGRDDHRRAVLGGRRARRGPRRLRDRRRGPLRGRHRGARAAARRRRGAGDDRRRRGGRATSRRPASTGWAQTHPGVDVVVYEGGQERYPVLVAVE